MKLYIAIFENNKYLESDDINFLAEFCKNRKDFLYLKEKGP